jgi:tRNA1(Val) A37 N6-methylase TrmN6
MSYSELSLTLTKKISKDEKKKNGIYFTPPKTVLKNIELLKPFMKNIKNVLEPSCGSCEYIIKLNELYPELNIDGIEYNKTIYEDIKNYETNKIQIRNQDFLKFNNSKKYDLIIGNPPYFVMKKGDVDKSYFEYFEGRPNIFNMFIIKSLKMLNNKGILSFVLPKSFLNCLYYSKTRNYINETYKIIDIIECNDDYIETKQETIIIIIQNVKQISNNNKYSIKNGNNTIFGIPKTISMLESLLKHSTTLGSLGFKVSVGNVVWNQCKKDLTDDNTNTLLVYSSDIKDNKLQIKKYSNVDKKNYIMKKGTTEPILVINRGYGVGKYVFNYCIINENDNIEYLVENHLICIKYTKDISREKLIELYNKIIKSFNMNNTKKFVQLYFGNNAINTKELCDMLPIYGM